MREETGLDVLLTSLVGRRDESCLPRAAFNGAHIANLDDEDVLQVDA